jgi:hypothetical protein
VTFAAYTPPHAGLVIAGLLVFAAACLGMTLAWGQRQDARLDASDLLGSRQLAGVRVCAPGTSRRIGLSSRGLGFLARQRRGGGTETPSFGVWGYLAVTDTEFALIELRLGPASLKPRRVIVRCPRSAVVSAELGPGSPAMPLTITFSNGDRWALEVPALSGSRARKLARVIVEVP